MLAGLYNIHIQQGADWKIKLIWKNSDGTPIDVTGLSARMQVRADLFAAKVAFQATNQTLGGATGEVLLTATAAETKLIVVDPKKITWVDGKPAQVMNYDIEVFSAVTGQVTRLLQGSAYILPEVTR